LDMTRAGSFGCEFAVRTTEPEQLLNATIPVKSTALIDGPAPATAGAAASTLAVNAPVSSAPLSALASRPAGLVVTAGSFPRPDLVTQEPVTVSAPSDTARSRKVLPDLYCQQSVMLVALPALPRWASPNMSSTVRSTL
jgi:hypothetical protein